MPRQVRLGIGWERNRGNSFPTPCSAEKKRKSFVYAILKHAAGEKFLGFFRCIKFFRKVSMCFYLYRVNQKKVDTRLE